jgi:5'-phosphate synthase pdxT subunit
MLRGLGAEARMVRTAADLETVDALVMPGGESTAMLRLMEAENLALLIIDRATAGMPILATCAGVILLARGVKPAQPSLGVLAIDIDRNAYGRQPHSTVAVVDLAPELGEPRRMEGVFIRAPRITDRGAGVEVLGTWNEDEVLVRQGRILAATFHPELATDCRIHELFVRLGEDHHG